MDHEHILTTLAHAPGWKTSSRTSQGQNCVEVTTSVPGWVGVRDTKKRPAGLLAFNEGRWIAFVNAAKAGHLDQR